MGKVYEAVDGELSINVALKILHEGDTNAVEQLKNGFAWAADVRKENLVKLGELFEHEHRWCFSMELVEGVDICSRGRWQMRRARRSLVRMRRHSPEAVTLSARRLRIAMPPSSRRAPSDSISSDAPPRTSCAAEPTRTAWRSPLASLPSSATAPSSRRRRRSRSCSSSVHVCACAARPHEPGEIDADQVAKSDACYSLSTGFAMVDAISGALYQTRSTRFALDSGDPGRAARALAIEACFVSAWGSKTRPRAGRIIDAAEKLAEDVGDPMMKGLARVGRGICELQWGDFNAAIANCDQGIALFGGHGTGGGWEEGTGGVFAIWALAWRGDWGEVARRCDALARAGVATGDKYATMHAAIAVAVCGPLASDQPELAKKRVADVMAGWPRGAYDLPQVRELIGLATIATYEGDGTGALRLLRSQWREIEKSRMLGLEPVLVTLADLRARAALLARDRPEATTWSKKLESVPWATGLAALFRAAVASMSGTTEQVLADLATAERDCTACGLDLHAAAAMDRRGRLLGGDEGAALVARAAEMAKKKEIRRPERAFAAVAPWPASSQS